jgi:hypothetical protein
VAIDAFAGANIVPLTFSPDGWCPPYQVPQENAVAASEKDRRDEIEIADLVRHGTPTVPIQTGMDGGTHPIFRERVRTATGERFE